MVSKLDVSPSTTHISAVAYSNNPEVVLRFSNQQSTEDVNSAFDGMRWQRGFTYTDKALLLADSDLFQSANGMRPSNVAKVNYIHIYISCFIAFFLCFFVHEHIYLKSKTVKEELSKNNLSNL